MDERDCGMESDDNENNGGLQGSQAKWTSKEGIEEGKSKVILDVFDDGEWTMLDNKRSVEFGHTTIVLEDQKKC